MTVRNVEIYRRGSAGVFKETSVTFADYDDYDGLGLAELVARGDVSALELVDEAIARIEALNPTLNCVVFEAFDQARKWATEQNAPGASFRGVPTLLKDNLGFCQGMPTTFGSNYIPAVPMPINATLVERMRAAGMIPVGKSNAPEFGLVCTTEPLRYGPARNPWNLAHSTGGSSGGAAAAVAAGIVPLAHANDGGGSIRIPAACCGLVGLKPTRARNPLGPLMGDAMSGLVAEHVVSRSVRDTAAALDATAGAEAGDPYWAPPAAASYLAEVDAPDEKFRIALLPAAGEAPRHPEVDKALADTVALLLQMGHSVEEPAAAPDLNLNESFLDIWCAGLCLGLESQQRWIGRPPEGDDLEPLTWAMVQVGKRVTASRYLQGIQRMQSLARRFARHYGGYDLTLTPTLNAPPLRLGELDVRSSDLDAQARIMSAFVPHTALFNMTGCPAISVPGCWTQAGLPVGMMFGAAFGDEARLIRIAAQLERARPWNHRRPPTQSA